MFTLTIDGVAVAITDGERQDAEALFESSGFKDDLRLFTSGGAPIWNGKSPLLVRPASEDEADLFEEAMLDDDEFDDEFDEEIETIEITADNDDEADEDDEFDDDDDGQQVMFLLPVDQLSEEE
jgi:hypothetical protein